MRFGRRTDPGPPPREGTPLTPGERLVRRTTLGLALMTMALIATLLAAVGVVTAAAAIRATDELVDRDLAAAAASIVDSLRPAETPEPAEPSAQPSTEPEDSAEPGDSAEPEDTGQPEQSGEPQQSEDPAESEAPASPNAGAAVTRATAVEPRSASADRLAQTVFAAVVPSPAPFAAPSVGPSPDAGAPRTEEDEDRPPGSSDTFFLILDPAGRLTANPQRVALAGLPDADAIAVATLSGEDWRTVDAGGLRVRLLTLPVTDSSNNLVAIVQSGFVLTQHDEQARQITYTIAVASLIGLLGAALVTLLVTRLALAPIRSAFAAERRFVASASHELRTPVAVVRASAEILQREDLVSAEGHKLVEDIVAESDRLGRLVGDLLALASADAGAITIERRPIEMRAFVTELARRAESIAGERGVQIEVVQDGVDVAADRELMVSADHDRMTQLLLIFIDNAIDHSPPGGVVRLVVRPVVEGGRPQVSVGVADQGPGVPREERTRIFEPFARLAGRRRQTGNTGLGLAIARILATRQDATLRVDDAAGGGAVFSVWLPRRPQSEASASA